jgi:hypothetical protein
MTGKQIPMWVIFVALISCRQGLGGDGVARDEQPRGHFWQRLHPEGGWNPYGGGVLHWWKRDCFPCYSAPDDYCRKPLPRVCWPQYPPYYTWGQQEIGYPPR